MSSAQLLVEMRHDVVVAAERLEPSPQRLRPRWLAAAAALVLVASLAGAIITTDDSASADLEVLRQGDELLITLHDVESRPDEIEAAATAAGLDISVVEVPVGPSNVGRFAGANAGRLPELLTVDRSDPTSSFTGFRVPVGFDAPITLELGRPARAGEPWAIPSSATAPGEPLECADVVGGSLSQALELIAATGGTTPRVIRSDTGQTLQGSALGQAGDLTVVRVEALAGGALVVHVVEDPASIPPQAPAPAQDCG